MATDDLLWMGDWAVGVRVWVERGAAVLGGGRLELLEEIDRCHSISAAARRIGMSYRHAWVMVQEVNRAAGELMIEAATGGRNGGGAARLTPHGRQAVAAFRDLQEQLRLRLPDFGRACRRTRRRLASAWRRPSAWKRCWNNCSPTTESGGRRCESRGVRSVGRVGRPNPGRHSGGPVPVRRPAPNWNGWRSEP